MSCKFDLFHFNHYGEEKVLCCVKSNAKASDCANCGYRRSKDEDLKKEQNHE